MPATDFGWLYGEKESVFQVYGTKRKNDQLGEDEKSVQCLAKKPCPGSARPEETDHRESMITDTEPLHITASTTAQQAPRADWPGAVLPQSPPPPEPVMWSTFPDVVVPEVNSALPTAQPTINNNTVIQRPAASSTSHCQSDMLMDLNGETYSDIHFDLMASADMESDGAPDPSQYVPQTTSHHTVIDGPSSSAGRVRCVCKPTWDTMLDTRPYISDYY